MLKRTLYLWITLSCLVITKGEPCPKSMGSRRSCTKQCASSAECPADSQCQCDGRCGLSCVKKGLQCKPPPKVRNAKFSTTGNSFNDVATYTCNRGYSLNGSPKKRCTAKGEWDGVGPTCMPACTQPELPFGAYVMSIIKSMYKTGDRIQLGCKTGFKQSGNPFRICISGRWTAFPFQCKATHSCPRTIRAARTKCTQKCSPQDVNGCQPNQKCLCDGQCGYSCVETGLSCGVPASIKNGFKQFNSTGYNATVRYWCKDGFTLDDDKTKRCTAKKRWEKPTPNCLPDCTNPPIPPNAYVENLKRKYASGDRVKFKCKPGYNQEGIPSTLCFMGRWNIIPFKCEIGGCGDPGVPENGNKVGISYGVNSEVFFSCNLGYIRIGSEQRRCLHNNTWSGVQPICKIVDCNKVQPPRNGSIQGNETTFQKSITYSCDQGFELKGPKNAICQSDGQWSVVSTCEAVDCGLPDNPLHGMKKGDASTYTSKIEYSCNPGYLLVGQEIRTCLHTGKWNGTEPTCQAVNCGELQPPRNGSVMGKLWTFPNSVQFVCDDGFDLLGSQIRTCTSRGKWNGTQAKCQAVNCGYLAIPLNGSLIGKETTYPAQVVFKCDEGFILKGSKIRKCQENRKWSGKEAHCEAKNCGKPTPLDSGTMFGSGTTYPEVIRYECEDGYILNGPATRQCQSNGKWSDFDPTCEAINCGTLIAPINGTIKGTDFTFPNVVEFACDKGFDLIGPYNRLCQANGSWSGGNTVCKAVDCGSLDAPTNGSMHGLLTTFPNTITFACDKGFILKGSSYRTCQADGKWNGDKAFCRAIDCGRLDAPLNGSKIGSLTIFPNRISFSCDMGFLMSGSISRKCEANGKWSGLPTRCEAVDCGHLAVPLNGSRLGKLTVYPNTINFDCDNGFDLTGSAVRRCQSNGSWSGMPVNCKAVDCGSLDVPQNGSVHGTLTLFPTVIKFSCDEGFVLRGSSSRACQVNRMWSGTATKCEAVNCGVLAIPLNGTMIGTATVFPETVRFQCDDGFELIGSFERQCLPSGNWSGRQPTCRAVDCGSLDVPQNGSAHGSLSTFPNIIKFSCDEGFFLRGSLSRNCQANMTWSGTTTRCEAVDCGVLPIPLNGSMYGTATVFPEFLTFQCDDGFDLMGSAKRQCLSSGRWSGRKPVCIPVDCGPLDVPHNGSFQGSLTVFPNVIKFSCDKGFLLLGSQSRTCQANRTWSGTTTQCEAVNCGVLPNPRKGSMIGTATVFPETVRFKCNEGFYLIGSEERQCLSSGKWSGRQPICKAVDCGPLDAPQNGSVHGSLTVFPNVIKIGCDEGFLLRGSLSRTCQANKTWSGKMAHCEAIDCGPLSAPINGTLVGEKTVFPEQVKFSCDKGFDLLGNETRKCLPTGKWNGRQPTCKAVDCGPLQAPRNGSVQGSTVTVFPSVKTFSCDIGFLLRGSSSRTCQANRTWSGTTVQCEAVDCGALDVPKNGSMLGAKTVFPNSASFACDDGFDLVGSSLRMCLSNGMWSGNKTLCQAVDCGPLAQPRNGSIYGSLTVYPNALFLTCDEGFLLRGSKSRVCQANRTWSGSQTSCEAIDCGPLPIPKNGAMMGNNTIFPNSVKFKCDIGFLLSGSSVRYCLSRGIWSGKKTTCGAVDCGPLDVPQNGSFQGSLTVFPNVIKFDCNEGFVLRGSSRRVCQYNKTWSGSLTLCTAVDCGKLDVPKNGSSQGSLTVFPNMIKFNCDIGFVLRGSSSRTCQANRTWSGTTARCEAKDCGLLKAPRNGSVFGNQTFYPNKMMFYCDDGFDLQGSAIRTCLSSGVWSGYETTCKAVDCGYLGVPLNGSRRGLSTTFPNVMKFQCDEGFILYGSSLRVCQGNRTWSGQKAQCIAVDCGQLDVPHNGSRQGSLSVFPNAVKFSCDKGFVLRGSSFRVCQANGTWNGQLTVCQAKDCGGLEVPKNGSMVGQLTVFPNKVKFGCDQGFDLVGSSVRSCLSNGTWSGKAATCKAVDCGSLVVPRNGSLHDFLTVFPNVIKFSCDEGFLLRGSSSRICQPNRTWTGTTTRCEARDCGSIMTPINGSVSGNRTFYPNKLVFYCDDGFDLLGSRIRMCLSSGLWSGIQTTCTAVDCGFLGVPVNGSRQGLSTTFPNVMKFHCDEGFILYGSSSRVCQANRTWSGDETRCKAIDCGLLAVPTNGSMHGKKTFFPNSVRFKCDKGFDLIGSSQRLCTSNGTWSGEQAFCRAVDCGLLDVPHNGSRQGSLSVFPNAVKFACDKGFLLRGSPFRVCQANGTWSGQLTVCQAKDCGGLEVPKNGSMVGQLTVFPNKVKFGCDQGFDLVGSSVRSCLSNGTWSGKAATCKAVDCGSLVVPRNGSLHGFLTVFPNVIKFSCDEGFLLRGSSSRICQPNRTWTGTTTRCEARDCGPILTPMNGSVSGNRTFYPNKLVFYCDDGFDLLGSQIRMCLSSGLWSGIQTTCTAVDCGFLGVPVNGSRQGLSTTFPNVMKFHCDEGFILYGSSSRVCQANRTWSGDETRCKAIDCGLLAVPTNGSMHGKKTFFPNSVRFKCDKGFDLIGSSQRLCTSNGTWSGEQAICRAVDCGLLDVPHNGSRQGSSSVFPNAVKFACDKGFLLRGSPFRVCQANGTWSGQLTVCQAKDCGGLEVPKNGSMVGQLTVFPNKVKFGCDQGFDLVGSSVRSCLSNGTWSGKAATCKAVDCGSLVVPRNGSLHGFLTVFPNVIKFSCDEGFLLRGSSSRICQPNRTWTGTTTRCEARDCGPILTPMNGSVFGNRTFYPNKLVFYCDDGFDLLGSQIRMCLSSGLWSGIQTTCTAVDCGFLGVPVNGSRQGLSTTFPNVMKFHCDEGFILYGSSSRVCQANRTWSGDETRCKAIDCGLLAVPTNGSMHGKKTFFPNSVRFKCDKGFDLIGSSQRVCTSNGTWSGEQAFCRAVDCGLLDVPHNGSRQGSSSVFPNAVKFACDKGFLLRGSPFRVCQANGTWSGQLTVCQAKDCGGLEVPKNGSMVGQLTVFPNKVKFGCDQGFDLVGSSVRSCLSNGTWSGKAATCKAVDCGSLVVPRNGSLHGFLTVFPNVIKFSCDEGFLLRGSSSRICQPNRTWTGTTTRCEARDCGPILTPINGSVSGNRTFYPNKLVFYCDDGFDLLGSQIRMCLSSGLWSGSPTSCKAIDCGLLAVPKNGSKHGKKTFFPNSVSFNCDKGFDLIGSSQRVCTSNGTWSGEQAFCRAVDCGLLDVPQNGLRQGSLSVFPNAVKFSCDKGFVLRGSSFRVCQANGTWSGQLTACQATDCGRLKVPRNGSMDGQLTVFPNKVKFGCDQGFDLVGSSVRSCLSNGTWSGKIATCKAVDCGVLTVPVNGSVAGFLTVFPNIVSFSCDRGFLLKGSSTRQCQANRQWSGVSTVCEAINCGTIREPTNGFSCGENTHFPHSIKFHCEFGYILVGPSKRRCQVNGRWTGTSTYCRAVDCGPVTTPKNGSKDGSVTVYPYKVRFSCHRGFILKGTNSIRCESSGKWSGSVPGCEAIDCGPLAVPLNGSRLGKLTVYPNILKFRCNNGFDLTGSAIRRCQSDGSWSGILANCKAVNCGPLSAPIQGYVKAAETTFSKMAYYSCNPGFKIKGNSVLICQANGTWNGTQPVCDAVDCGSLPSLSNGFMKGSLTVYPNKVSFVCDEGFSLIGSFERQCLVTGQWSGNQPYCRGMRCKNPSIPLNSYMTSRTKAYYDNEYVVFFSCNPGFFLRGDKPSITCIHGKWSKADFICAAPKCKPPRVPINAYITFPRGKNGPYLKSDEVFFSCKSGYYLTGNPSIRCEDGWTSINFKCNPVECGPLPYPLRGYIKGYTGTTYQQVYTFGCHGDRGFKIKGSRTRKCQANKQWSGVQPFCYLLSCPNPGTPTNGFKLNSNYTYNNIVRFGCNSGYSQRGFRAIRCQLNARWTAKRLTCLECTSAIGMRNYKITNEMMQASSDRDSRHKAKNGRLFNRRAWCSARSEYEKYLQVDFGTSIKELTAIATQGHPTEYKWMNKYELRFALGARWFTYRVNGKVKVFEGNKDRNSVMKHILRPSIIAHKIRIYQYEDTQSFSGSSVCLRAEFYGCDFYSDCITKGATIMAMWYKYSLEVIYVRGYVTNIDDETLTVIPHDKHKSLMHGSILVVHKRNSDQIYKDNIPEPNQIYIGQLVLALTHKDGLPIYNTGKVKDIQGSRNPWYQVSLDGSGTIWRNRKDLRLRSVPELCDLKPNTKIEIKRH